MTHWQTLLAIDFDKHAARTYAANFPGVRVECGPVQDFIDTLPAADVVLGGPPCQPHSLSGKREASADARDGGPDFVAAVRRVKPRHFLMENVPGLVSSEGGRYWQRLYASMEDAGYAVQYRVQDAVAFGVPQFRSRLWVWGIRSDLYAAGMRHAFPVPTHAWPPPEGCMFGAALLPGVTVGEALGLEGEIRRVRGAGIVRRDHPTTEPSPTIYDLGATGTGLLLMQDVTRDHKRQNGSGERGDSPGYTVDAMATQGIGLHVIPPRQNGCPPTFPIDEPSRTIGATRADEWKLATSAPSPYRWSDAMLAKHPPALPALPAPTVMAKWLKGGAEGLLAAGPWKHKGELWVRRLSPLECARLQSVPDSFIWPEGITKTAAYRIVGNGWACGHAAHFARAIAAVDPEARTCVDLFCGGGLGASGWHGRHWNYEARKVGAA